MPDPLRVPLAVQAGDREQPQAPPTAPQPTAQRPPKELAASRPGTFSLYSWLTWGSGSAASSSSSSDAEDQAAELADGMAAEPARAAAAASASGGGAAASSRRRSWAGLSLGGSGSSYDFEDATGQRQQQQQYIPVRVDHPALQLLRQRALSRSHPTARKDPFKLGLVVEGGGMRGCVSGGALQALADVGLRDAFDAVYGSSAGAINSTYFLSGGWVGGLWGMRASQRLRLLGGARMLLFRALLLLKRAFVSLPACRPAHRGGDLPRPHRPA